MNLHRSATLRQEHGKDEPAPASSGAGLGFRGEGEGVHSTGVHRSEES